MNISTYNFLMIKQSFFTTAGASFLLKDRKIIQFFSLQQAPVDRPEVSAGAAEVVLSWGFGLVGWLQNRSKGIQSLPIGPVCFFLVETTFLYMLSPYKN